MMTTKRTTKKRETTTKTTTHESNSKAIEQIQQNQNYCPMRERDGWYDEQQNKHKNKHIKKLGVEA